VLVAGIPSACGDDAPVGSFPASSRSSWESGIAADSLPKLAAGATLRDYLQYASLNNPGLRAAHSHWLAAMKVIPQAKSLPDPMFSYTYYIQHVETRVGPQRQRFALSQMFPWFGKLRLRGDAAAKAAEAAWLDLQSQRLRLLYHVSTLYQDYCYLKQAIDVTQENFDLVKSLEAVARQRYRTGQALTAVVQAQVELGKMEDQLRSLRDLRPALTAKLNAALNRDRDAELPWPAAPVVTLPELDAKTIRAEVRRRNPELTRLATLASKETISAELARKNRYPDITLGVSMIDTGSASMPGVADSGKDPIMATVAINLPIWRSKYRAQEREALLRRSALLDQREDKGNGLEGDAALALYHYQDAARKIGLYGDTLLPKAEQSLAVAQQAFEAGKTDFMTLIDAQRVLLEFRLAVAKARADQGKRFAELQMLTGAGLLQTEPSPSE
jgi:outer membrane protein TolC